MSLLFFYLAGDSEDGGRGISDEEEGGRTWTIGLIIKEEEGGVRGRREFLINFVQKEMGSREELENEKRRIPNWKLESPPEESNLKIIGC